LASKAAAVYECLGFTKEDCVKHKLSQPARKLGLVLSGGGARGAFQVGVYERLLRDPRFADGPAVISGTSAGAINGALIAAGKSPREMMDFWNGIADNPPATASDRFFDTALRSLLRLSITESLSLLLPSRRWLAFWQRARNHFPPRRGSALALFVEYLLTTRFELVSHFLERVREPFVVDISQLRERLRDAFGGDYLPSSDVRLAINTVDAHTGHVVRFVNAPTSLTRPPDYIIVDAISVDMILASASIPLLFPPVAIGGRQLWDGGLLVNTPLAPVVALGADEIVTVLVTEPPDPDEEPFPHFGRAVERTVDSFLENAYNVDRKLLLERNRLVHVDPVKYRQVKLYEAIRPLRDGGVFNAGSYLYFEREVLHRMRTAGKRAATMWLRNGPVEDELEEAAEAA
jgi:predicted acylesterase/phospholipase RssA